MKNARKSSLLRALKKSLIEFFFKKKRKMNFMVKILRGPTAALAQ